jgi:uncharacterized protein (TIGR02118 family)
VLAATWDRPPESVTATDHFRSPSLRLRNTPGSRVRETTKGGTMVKLVVLYGRPEDPDAFERYYADTHTALAKAVPGLRRFEAARGVATPDGTEVPYQRIAELTFDDVEALQAGIASDQGQAAVNDIPNFATGGVTIFIADIDD